MATIWTGTLVSTGTTGLLSTPKTVYLNAAFTYKVVQTTYIDNAGVTQTGTQVEYLAGDGTEILNLIFSDGYTTIRNSINTQPTLGTDTLNVYDIDVLDVPGGVLKYSISLPTAKIWWMEDAGVNDTYLTYYNNTLDNRVTLVADVQASTAQTDINN